MTPASPLHSDIAEFIDRQFYQEVLRLGLDWKIKSDTGVRTQEQRSRLPDVSVITGEAWRKIRESKSAVLQEPVILAVEVVSPGEANHDRDYDEKRLEYQTLGISEYWIVDPQEEQVLVLLLVEGKYQTTVFRGNQQIVSQTLPKLKLTVEQVLGA